MMLSKLISLLFFLILFSCALAGSTFDLNSAASYALRYYGGAAGDQLGANGGAGLSVQLVSVDGGDYNNDLLLTDSNAIINNKVSAGAVYLFKNVDTSTGSKNLGEGVYDVMWNGGAASDKLGNTYSSGLGVQLVNVDGGGYSNDLLLTAPYADVNSKTDVGVIYLVKNIDGLSGAKDLNDLSNFDVRWNGGAASDFLGRVGSSVLGVQLVSIDGGVYSNDLLITAPYADVNRTNSGAVYLIKNIDGLSGAKDLNSLSNFDVRWNGGAANDYLGIGAGLGVQLVNVDGGAYSNDLLLTAYLADVNGLTDAGAVYLIKGVDGLSGAKDLSSLSNFDVRWSGGAEIDKLSNTNLSGLGAQLVNVDGNAYSNDLLLTAYAADVNSKGDAGAVYLIKNIDGLSGAKDLSSLSNFDVEC
ncbi:MAG: hypothetical protein NTY48_05735 [Candidatus Diapherotrites archaeon]|nr:hypothetical protein [Candidatus Diapherotrites archaeon]